MPNQNHDSPSSHDFDRLEERLKYDAVASEIRQQLDHQRPLMGIDNIGEHLVAPYEAFRKALVELIKPHDHVLELGSGYGRFTSWLCQTQAAVTAFDISWESLEVAQRLIPELTSTVAGDMSSLPFQDSSFDFIVSAGSLSYGPAHRVDSEILRVLRPGGSFIVVDSMNDNPVFRLNRWVQSLLGKRTRLTYSNMPNQKRIQKLSASFSRVKIEYFGSFVFMYPMVVWLIGKRRARNFFLKIDRSWPQKSWAFKFVLVAEDLKH